MRQHRRSIARAAFGGALLALFWLLWPESDGVPVERHLWDRRLEEQFRNHAGGWASGTQAGVTVSAKGQLVAATPGQAPLEQEVAEPIPAIGPPESLPDDGTTVLPGSAALKPEATDPIEMAALPPSEPPALMAASNGVVPQPPPVAPRFSGVAGAAPIAHAAAAGPSEPGVSDEVIPAARLARTLGPIGLVPPDMAVPRLPTWLQNAVAPVIDDRPAIAIVIDDVGPNRVGTAALNNLPAPLTLAFLPYADNRTEQVRAARAAGHELLLHIPMEPLGPEWPGPNALLGSLEPAELLGRLRTQLSSFRGFVGVSNHMGSLLTADSQSMSLVMAELRRDGLLFLDSRTTPASVAGNEARRNGVPYAERDVFLDNEVQLDAVQRQLALTEAIARRQGHAVAIGHPHAATIEALRGWLPSLAARGFALVPISAIVARRTCAEGTLAIESVCAPYTATASLVR